MKTNPNDASNPTLEQGGDLEQWYTMPGLTKREYFAAIAMQGLISKYGVEYQSDHLKEAIYFADELINALNK